MDVKTKTDPIESKEKPKETPPVIKYRVSSSRSAISLEKSSLVTFPTSSNGMIDPETFRKT